MAEETQTLEETREEAREEALKELGAEREIIPQKLGDLGMLYLDTDKFIDLCGYSEIAREKPFDPKNLEDLADNLGIKPDLAAEIGSERLQREAYKTFFSDRNALYNTIEMTGLERILSDTEILPDESLFNIIQTLSEYKPTPWDELEEGKKGKSFLFATGIKEHDEIIELLDEIKGTLKYIRSGRASQIVDKLMKDGKVSDFIASRWFRLRNFAADRVATSYVSTLQDAYTSKFTTEDGKERKVDRSKVINFIKETVGGIKDLIRDNPLSKKAIVFNSLEPIYAAIAQAAYPGAKQLYRDTYQVQKQEERKKIRKRKAFD